MLSQFSNFCLSVVGTFLSFMPSKSRTLSSALSKLSHLTLELHGTVSYSIVIFCMWFKTLFHMKFSSFTTMLFTWFIFTVILHSTSWWIYSYVEFRHISILVSCILLKMPWIIPVKFVIPQRSPQLIWPIIASQSRFVNSISHRTSPVIVPFIASMRSNSIMTSNLH
jgi:hypothetical protein